LAKPGTKRYYLEKSIVHLILLGFGFFFFLPFYWVVASSLKTQPQLFKLPPVWIPNPVVWANYPDALRYIPFFDYLKNTVYYCTLTVIGALISNSLVAYSFSRVHWFGRDFVFVIVLSTMMIPFQVVMIPLFIIFRRLGWLNTFRPLIIPAFFGSPFFIFLLRQFFLTIPYELSDAAKIDGAGDFTIYWRVILPLSKPALATVALFEFLYRWNDFLGPLIYLRDDSMFTLALGLRSFMTLHGAKWALLMAASAVTTLPVLILFFFAQRTFIEGIALTGMKG